MDLVLWSRSSTGSKHYTPHPKLLSTHTGSHHTASQGCPLSPFLFAIFIEPLAATISQNNIIKGVDDTNHHHKTSLYADDIIVLTGAITVTNRNL